MKARSGSGTAVASVDVRALAAFRLGLALVILVDLAARARSLTAHYSDLGVVPREVVVAWQRSSGAFLSVHLLGGQSWVQGLLFGLAALAAIALLCGYRTRLASLASWVLLLSLQWRNPALLHGGDVLLRVLLFWGLFLPLGETWSIDALRCSAPSRGVVRGLAPVALLLQLCFMYWFTGLLKWHPMWVGDGTAIAAALELDQLTTWWGRSLRSFPAFLAAATWGTMVLELVGPALVWSPRATARLRTVAAATFTAFHLVGLAPALRLGIFPWVCAVGWLVVLPGPVWDRLEALPVIRRVGVRASRAVGRWGRWLPETPRWALREVPFVLRVRTAIVAGLLVYTCLWNIRAHDRERFGWVLPESWSWLGQATGLAQYWNLFAPYPALDDGWWVVDGTLADGATVDPWRDAPVSWEKPRPIGISLGSGRWRKYLMNLYEPDFSSFRKPFGEWLCRQWNEERDDSRRLTKLDLHFELELTRPGQPPAPVEDMIVLRYHCRP